MKVTNVSPLEAESLAPNPPAPAAAPQPEAPLDEAAGLNADVDALTDQTLQVCIDRIKANIPRLVQRMQAGEEARLRFSDPGLQGTVLGNLLFDVTFVADEQVEMLRLRQGALLPPTPQRTVIELEFGYGQVLVHAPRIYQVKSFLRLLGSDDFKTTLTHELTHAVQVIGRQQNNQGDTSASLELAKHMMDDKMPELYGIGRRIYLADDFELGARVAEVGKIMRDQAPGTSTEALIQQIKHSRVWQEMRYLGHFPAQQVYQKILNLTREHYADQLPDTDLYTLEDFVSANVLAALKSIAFERPSRLSNQLRRAFAYSRNGQAHAKDLRSTLEQLEAIFTRRAEQLKRAIFKTISLARQAAPAPQAELAEGSEELAEAYPASFDMAEFRDLRNFKQRIEYCEAHLQRLGSGSARIAYAVDADKVLKLAKNAKGIAQNEAESQGYLQQAYGDIVTRRYDAHPDDLWVEMERARKLTPAKFKALTGVSLDDLANYLLAQHNPDFNRYGELDPHVRALCEDSDFVLDVNEMVGSMEMNPGDMGRISSWGLVTRQGQERVVLVDFGLTNQVYATHYSKRHRAYA